MSLRTALAALPDDRAAIHAVREVIGCFASHRGVPMPAARVSSATGLEPDRVLPVLRALVAARVLDFDHDSGGGAYTFDPDSILQLEVDRFLRSGNPDAARMQSSIGRFRSRLGHG